MGRPIRVGNATRLHRQHWQSIRTEEATGNPIQERCNFTLHEMRASTFSEMVRYLYRQQTTAFKINLSFGFILRNIVTGVLRYYHSSQNNARFFDVSHLFRIEDLERFLEELSRHDILEYIRQQMGVTPPRTDLYRRCHLQVSWWRVPFTTDRIRFELIGRKWRLLIGQISWLSIG